MYVNTYWKYGRCHGHGHTGCPSRAGRPGVLPNGLNSPLDRETAQDLAQLLKAVADPARLQLLALIKASDGGESCVCNLTAPLGLSQPTVSHHLKVLTDTGILRRERRGVWSWFSVVPERLAEIAAVIC